MIDLGDEDPLYTRNISNGPPDRRRVSLRWLAASVLTGIFSVALVGGALQAAIGLDEYSVVRPALAHGMAFGDAEVAEKGDRFRPVPESQGKRRVIQISTVTRERGPQHRARAAVRARAHQPRRAGRSGHRGAHARLPGRRNLHRRRGGQRAEPIPAIRQPRARLATMDTAASDSIYGAEVDGEVEIKTVDFPTSGVAYDEIGGA